MSVNFSPGRNIAMKIPAHEYEHTVRFYREVLALRELTPAAADEADATPRFDFGGKVLWLDRVPGLSQSELWLEVVTDDIEAAAAHLQREGCARRDEIEALPDGFAAFWVSSPCNIIHLVAQRDAGDG